MLFPKIKFVLCLFFYMMLANSCIEKKTEDGSHPITIKEHFTYSLRYRGGGYDTIFLDTKTPLNQLIGRLDTNEQIVDMRKGYWYGFTDLMYSIAYRKDSAIEPLLKLINTNKSIKTKDRAVATIYLIGIGSKPQGRMSDKFIDTCARVALYSLLNDSVVSHRVHIWLQSSYWKCDMYYYMNMLSTTEKNAKNLPSRIYHSPEWISIKNVKIPANILNKKVNKMIVDSNMDTRFLDLLCLKKRLGNILELDTQITNSKIWKTFLKFYNKKTNKFQSTTVFDILESMENHYSFIFPYTQVHYVYQNKKIKVYLRRGGERDIWLTWWNVHKNEYSKLICN